MNDRLLTHSPRAKRYRNLIPAFVWRYRRYYQSRVARTHFQPNLLAMHDILADTPFGSRYWMIGGLLIGWARDGMPLAWDCADTDFAYQGRDRVLFDQAAEKLLGHGFKFAHHWYNSAGVRTQSVFYKDHIKFDFFELTADENYFRYFVYGMSEGVFQEAVCQVSKHGIEPFSFLGRVWNKPDDHARYLTQVYGAWRVPNKDFDFMRDQCDIVQKAPWRGHIVKQFQ